MTSKDEAATTIKKFKMRVEAKHSWRDAEHARSGARRFCSGGDHSRTGAEHSRGGAKTSCSGVDNSKTEARHSYSVAEHCTSYDELSRNSAEHFKCFAGHSGGRRTSIDPDRVRLTSK